jgi:hypothetical protein
VHEVDLFPDEESTQPWKPAQVVVTRDPEAVNRHSDRGELLSEMLRRAGEHVGDVVVEPLPITGSGLRKQELLGTADRQSLDEMQYLSTPPRGHVPEGP